MEDDQLYALSSTTGDYMHPPETMECPPSICQGFLGFPAFASTDPMSDDASMVAQIQRVGSEEDVSSAIRAKIASHPFYPKLLQAYIDCQKVYLNITYTHLFGCRKNDYKMKNRVPLFQLSHKQYTGKYRNHGT